MYITLHSSRNDHHPSIEEKKKTHTEPQEKSLGEIMSIRQIRAIRLSKATESKQPRRGMQIGPA